MFAIEFFTGRRFGTWLASSTRFDTEAEASTTITTQVRAERAADITPFKRRVRAVQGPLPRGMQATPALWVGLAP